MEIQTAQRERKNIMVYCCGGAAQNLSTGIVKMAKELPEDAFARIDVSYVDTSDSNIPKEANPEDVYIISGLGSGQKRSTHAAEMIERLNEVLHTFKPAHLNIVLSSLSGGSGGVLAALTAKELAARGLPVIVIGIGDANTKLYAQNTLNSLRTYENMIKQTELPFVMAYFQNGKSETRKETDAYVLNAIKDLACLFSGQNTGLDSQDLYHFINYNLVTDHPPMLASLSIVGGEESLEETFGAPMSVATLGVTETDTDYPHPIDVQFLGIVPPSLRTKEHSRPLHFVISDGLFDVIGSRLEETIKQIDEARIGRTARKSLGLGNAKVDDDSGLVL